MGEKLSAREHEFEMRASCSTLPPLPDITIAKITKTVTPTTTSVIVGVPLSPPYVPSQGKTSVFELKPIPEKPPKGPPRTRAELPVPTFAQITEMFPELLSSTIPLLWFKLINIGLNTTPI